MSNLENNVYFSLTGAIWTFKYLLTKHMHTLLTRAMISPSLNICCGPIRDYTYARVARSRKRCVHVPIKETMQHTSIWWPVDHCNNLFRESIPIAHTCPVRSSTSSLSVHINIKWTMQLMVTRRYFLPNVESIRQKLNKRTHARSCMHTTIKQPMQLSVVSNK
jgi:hypothetical protein